MFPCSLLSSAGASGPHLGGAGCPPSEDPDPGEAAGAGSDGQQEAPDRRGWRQWRYVLQGDLMVGGATEPGTGPVHTYWSGDAGRRAVCPGKYLKSVSGVRPPQNFGMQAMIFVPALDNHAIRQCLPCNVYY